MGWTFRKPAPKQWGLALYQQRICLADTQGASQSWPCQSAGDWPGLLAGLPVGPGDQVKVILPHSELHGLSLDKPRSEPVQEALFWALKDAVPIAPQDLQFDYYDPPAQPMGAERVNVVCTSKDLLKGICQALPAQVLAVSNEDMVLRHLFPVQAEGRPLLLLRLNGDGDLQLAIYHQGMLYFSRWLQGYRLGNEDQDPYLLAERLALDIQRALDYLESQLRQSPIDCIVLALSNLLDEALGPLLADTFGLPVQTLGQRLAINDTDWAALAAARGADEALA